MTTSSLLDTFTNEGGGDGEMSTGNDDVASNGADDNNNNSDNNNNNNNNNESVPATVLPAVPVWTTFDVNDDLTASSQYGLSISAVVPRPVAVITTVDRICVHDDDHHHHDKDDTNVNCAPFSYTGLLSHDPPIISHGFVLMSDGRKKDTLTNIEATGKWVVHVLSTNYLTQANMCSASLPRDVDETKVANLPLLYDTTNGVPRLVDAKVAMECTLWDTREVINEHGKHTTTIVLGKVTRFHIHNTVLKYKDNDSTRPLVDLHALRGVGRAGDITYWPVGTSDETVLAMERPK